MDFVGIYILQYVGEIVKGIWGFCGERFKLQFIVPINCNSEIRFACEMPAA